MDRPVTLTKRTQLDRRIETQRLLIDSATRLFGERGYEATSLEDIAHDCGLTTGPIYHYYGSKKELFRAVHDTALEGTFTELRRVAAVDLKSHMQQQLRITFDLYREPGLFRILLVDGRTVLGEGRWSEEQFRAQLQISLGGAKKINARELTALRVLYAAVREAILMLAEADNQPRMRRHLIEVINPMLETVAARLEEAGGHSTAAAPRVRKAPAKRA